MKVKFEIPKGVKINQVFVLRETTIFQYKLVNEDFYDNNTKKKRVRQVKHRIKVLGTKMETIKNVKSIREAISKIKNPRTVAAAAWIGRKKEKDEINHHMIIESGEFINQLKSV